MAKKINITGRQPKRIRVADKPQRRIEPAELAVALGAEPCAERIGDNLDLISLAELGAQLLRRLRSTGGRPALSDATEFCRVPLSAEDMKALERISAQVEQKTGANPSPGQIASIIVRDYLRMEHSGSTELGRIPTTKDQANEHMDAFTTACLALLAEFAKDASAVQKKISAIESSAREISQALDRSKGEALKLLRQDSE
jgi:hypothetical protein